jgi:hypothetical protein
MKIRATWSLSPVSWLPLLLALTLPLALLLPPWVGWENGPLENLQVVLLLMGAWVACAIALHDRRHPALHRFWYCVAPLWLLCVGRELSWGRVFFPVGMDASGPVFISAMSYDAVIRPLAIAVTVASLVGMLWQRPFRLLARCRLPLTDVVIMLAAALIANAVDKGYWPALLQHEETVEEWAELIVYSAMLGIELIVGLPSLFGSERKRRPSTSSGLHA